MSLQHGILGLLNNQELTGYEIGKIMESPLNFLWKGTPSQVYKELNYLEKKGLIKHELIIQEDKPNKKIYSVTPKGVEELKNWVASFTITDTLNKYRNPFLLKVLFSNVLEKDEQKSILVKSKEELLELKDKLIDEIKIDSNSPLFSSVNEDEVFLYSLVADFGERLLGMTAEWLDASVKKIEKQKK